MKLAMFFVDMIRGDPPPDFTNHEETGLIH